MHTKKPTNIKLMTCHEIYRQAPKKKKIHINITKEKKKNAYKHTITR